MKYKNDKKGFTLVELMVVVAIIGALSSVAIPAVAIYIRQSKTSEAFVQLKSLGDSATQYYQVDHNDALGNPIPDKMFPTPSYVAGDASVASNPSSIPKASKVVTVWSSVPWFDLKFQVTKAHYYQYRFNSQEVGSLDTFTADAVGDLDGDEVTTTFRVTGTADQDDKFYVSPPVTITPSDIE